MADQDLYSGLVRLHVLYHASAGVIFGLGMIRELRHHGYRVGPGTLYPILHRMERKGIP
jgi:PadR family transcriptional regulator PadR